RRILVACLFLFQGLVCVALYFVAHFTKQTLKFLSKPIGELNIPVPLIRRLFQQFHQLFFFGLVLASPVSRECNRNAPRKNCLRQSLRQSTEQKQKGILWRFFQCLEKR